MPDYKKLCAELAEKLDELNCHYNVPNQSAMIERAHDALTEQPEVPTDEELSRIYQSAYGPAWERGEFHSAHPDGLRAVLARCGRPAPAPQPIPVTERLPGGRGLRCGGTLLVGCICSSRPRAGPLAFCIHGRSLWIGVLLAPRYHSSTASIVHLANHSHD